MIFKVEWGGGENIIFFSEIYIVVERGLNFFKYNRVRSTLHYTGYIGHLYIYSYIYIFI